MIIAEITDKQGGAQVLRRIASRHFVLVDGEPARRIAPNGTLLGVVPFVWGESWDKVRHVASLRTRMRQLGQADGAASRAGGAAALEQAAAEAWKRLLRPTDDLQDELRPLGPLARSVLWELYRAAFVRAAVRAAEAPTANPSTPPEPAGG